MKKEIFLTIITGLIIYIAVNSIFQSLLLTQMYSRMQNSIAMASEANKIAAEGMKSIKVLFEVEKYALKGLAYAKMSDKMSAGITTEELEKLLQDDKKVWNEIVHRDSPASLVLFIKSMDLGRKSAPISKKSLRNAEKLLAGAIYTNKKWKIIQNYSLEMAKLTEQYVKIINESKELTDKMVNNTRVTHTKLLKYKKFFKNRVKMLKASGQL